ncbi:MAG: hypothetical protein JNG88_06165 [Phycisphaerales bacterium]|nr:hypothetical protein [Phycisphaerales bacterium]
MADGSQRTLTLVKGEEHYMFRYREGEESRVLSALVALAGDPRSEFDWYDAAVLSYQLGQGEAVRQPLRD